MENADYPKLEKRLGRELLASRLLKQAGKTARLLHQGEGAMRIERVVPLDQLVSIFLRVSGLAGAARRGFLNVRTVEQTWHLPRLPRAFDGFRFLQITDLHADLDPALTEIVVNRVAETPHDAVGITGDFRNKTSGDYSECIAETARIAAALAPRRWGVLGNHDFVEMVPSLEQIGLPILLNEVSVIESGRDRLWIAGIDDPHFYKTHDLNAVRAAIPRGECAILLAHSPEVYAEAAVDSFDLQLSGHTHGGQLCLPGGRHIVIPCRLPPRFLKGRWAHGSLQGYTSPGTGSCGVAARLNCPPEITLHILRCGRPGA